MSTQRLRFSNRANAQKSTGPVTPEGKAASSRNRLSHGFFSQTRFLRGEAPEEFWALLDDFISEHQPATPTEQVLIEKMAQSQWTSLRISSIQVDIMNNQQVGDRDGILRCLALFHRYQTTADRTFFRAHTELIKAQKGRPKSANGFESQKAADAVAIPPETPAPPPPPPPPPPQKPAAQPPQAPEFPDFKNAQEAIDFIEAEAAELERLYRQKRA